MNIYNHYRLITFDVYTAFFDIENSLTPQTIGNSPSSHLTHRYIGNQGSRIKLCLPNREQQPYLDTSYVADYETKDLAGLLEILE